MAKLAFGAEGTNKAIVYNHKPTATDFVMRATYVGSAGNCGRDGTNPITHNPVYRWDCSDVDAFIDEIADTTYSIAFDPENCPVIAWNNKRNDEAQRLYVTYPAARYNPAATGWKRDIVDGNDWSFTGTLGDIAISEAGLGLIGYMQPSFRACGELFCPFDHSPNLKAALQWFTNSLPIIRK